MTDKPPVHAGMSRDEYERAVSQKDKAMSKNEGVDVGKLRRENAALRAALEDAMPYVREAAETVGYGFFCGGDPHDFHPDHECSTEEEIAAHKAACEAYAANREALKNPSEWLRTEDGKRVAHILRAPFGMGSYVIRDRDGMDLLERISALTPAGASDE